MQTRWVELGRRVALVGLWVLAACGGEGGTEDIAKAFAGPAKADADAGKTMADFEAKAEADAAKARADELQKVTEVPAEAGDLEAACTDAGAALDAFKQKRIVAEELARWNATKEPDIRKFVEACKETGNPRVAACRAKALREATVANFGPDSVDTLVEHCSKRWGETAAP